SYCHNLIDLDVSRGMLKANTSSSQKIQTDLNALPFRRNIADGIFSVAAIHHIMSKSNRELLLREISKIGKKDGLIVFTVWRFYQNKFKLEYKQQIHNLQKISKNFELGDVMVPWKLFQNGQNLMISRFYHLFRISEFNEFIKNAHFLLPYYFGTFKTKNLKKNFIFIGKNRK
ncbi:MAG: methyltransferase domain-containing protein, partial [Promethearchaeota archaeon]